jgi:type I restriction enzyme M protein
MQKMNETLIGSGYDYVISNPPYGVKVNGYEVEYLSFAFQDFDKSKSSLKSLITEIAFCEFALECVEKGGKIGLLLPNSVLSNESYQKHRNFLIEKMRLWLSLSLPAHAFYFSGTNVKTGFLLFEKWQSEAFKAEDYNNDYQVVMAICNEIGFDSRGKKAVKNELPQIVNEFLAYKNKTPPKAGFCLK